MTLLAASIVDMSQQRAPGHRSQALAEDKQQAALLGYGLVDHGARSDTGVETWGRCGLASTLERSEQDGWVLIARDERGRTSDQPLVIGVAQECMDNVVWALVEVDRPRYYRWSAWDGDDQCFTVVHSQMRSVLVHSDEAWHLRTWWPDGTMDDTPLHQAWSAREAQVLADLTLRRQQKARSEVDAAERIVLTF